MRIGRVRDEYISQLHRDFDPTICSAAGGAAFFVGSPFPVERLVVNWRMNSSRGLEVAAFSWMLMPAFSLRMRLSRVLKYLC
jgi:hypothetical protein